jgi:hypothetical protein
VFLLREVANQLAAASPLFLEKPCGDGDDEKGFGLAQTMFEFSIEFFYLQHASARTLNGAPYIWALYFKQAFWVTQGKVWGFLLQNFVAAGGQSGCLWQDGLKIEREFVQNTFVGRRSDEEKTPINYRAILRVGA